jgi:hypothetical protein
MRKHLIYADTSFWNQLCDQSIEPRRLASSLAEQDAEIVLGLNVFFEMSKTFEMQRQGAVERASKLFTYLSSWMREGVSVVRQNPEILVDEALHALGRAGIITAFLDSHDHRELAKEIARLGRGKGEAPPAGFIGTRKSTATEARTNMVDHLQSAPQVKARLRTIPASQLTAWTKEEAGSGRGIQLLVDHLDPILGNVEHSNLYAIARILLGSQQYRASRALVRNGICLNWRIANRESIPKSSLDDAYHVVGASYCTKFVTNDPDQALQANSSLDGVQVGLCGMQTPLLDWLIDNSSWVYPSEFES